jgi:hypothetical protein
MKVLIACEFSGIVRDAFSELGHEATSCDLRPSERKGNHIQGDVLSVLNDGWDLMVAHPPCTYLTTTGNRWFLPEFADRYPDRPAQREKAVEFFMKIVNAPIEKIAIENPVGVMSTLYRQPDQIIQPYEFGEKNIKRTCLWLKGLPKLDSTKIVTPEYVIYNSNNSKTGKKRYPLLWGKCSRKDIEKKRSVTFSGIAKAMAYQWSNTLF